MYLCVTVFFKGHRKSLSEPGVSCSTSMSLVCIAASLVFDDEEDDVDDTFWSQVKPKKLFDNSLRMLSSN